MKPGASLDSNAGFTITELLVVLILLGIVFSYVLGYIRFTNRQFGQWYAVAESESILPQIYRTIQRDIDTGRLRVKTDSLVVDFGCDPYSTVTYHQVDGHLIRNGKEMYPQDFQLDSICLQAKVVDTRDTLREFIEVQDLTTYAKALQSNEKEYIYIVNYSLQIFTDSDRISERLIFRPRADQSVFQPLCLANCVVIGE